MSEATTTGAASVQDRWTAVDEHISRTLIGDNEELGWCLRASTAAGLPEINVAPNQGKFLMLMAKAIGAKRILEIGTLGGYSTIWLARALAPGGRLTTLEFNPEYAAVARRNIAEAGFADVVTVHVGPALETLTKLRPVEPFDLVFIDADKVNTPAYFEWSLKLTRPGSVIICDNVVRDGELINPESKDPGVPAMRTFLEMAGKDKRVSATAIQTVGLKGYDGFAMALVV